MQYWLIKSEPSAYSWDQFVKEGGTFWNGACSVDALGCGVVADVQRCWLKSDLGYLLVNSLLYCLIEVLLTILRFSFFVRKLRRFVPRTRDRKCAQHAKEQRRKTCGGA